jgi:RNA polymerase sigma-54 factor
MEEIAYSRTPPIDMQTLEAALAEVQTLEPAGVGARDLSECLLIQLEGMEEVDPLCEALARDHLVSLAKNMFPRSPRPRAGASKTSRPPSRSSAS